MPRSKGAIAKNREFPARKLRKLLKAIHSKLTVAGVPKVRLPTNDSVLSHVLDWLDQSRVDDWVSRFAEAQGTKPPVFKVKIRRKKSKAKSP